MFFSFIIFYLSHIYSFFTIARQDKRSRAAFGELEQPILAIIYECATSSLTNCKHDSNRSANKTNRPDDQRSTTSGHADLSFHV